MSNEASFKPNLNDWDLAKSMGVTCQIQEGIVVSKLTDMEERDKEEAKRLGSREQVQ